jgi:hypothetical protein
MNTSAGDPAFVLGFPLGEGSTHNSAVVRGGCIGEIHEARIGVSDVFLADIWTVSGNSGGPVILRTDLAEINGDPTWLLLGILHSYVPIRYVHEVPHGFFKFAYMLNFGLTRCFTVDAIQATFAGYIDKIGE